MIGGQCGNPAHWDLRGVARKGGPYRDHGRTYSCPQRCCAAWRVMLSREPISGQE